MVNRGIVALIVIIVIVIIGGIYLYSPQTTNQTQNVTPQNITTEQNKTPQNISKENVTVNKTPQTKISAEQARQIALQFIEVPGAYPGVPTLSKWPDERLVWTVPVISNGKVVSGIVIDAQTGENLGQG